MTRNSLFAGATLLCLTAFPVLAAQNPHKPRKKPRAS